METQNLLISFDYSWFLAKNFAYAECLIMKFHYRNSSIVDLSEFVELVHFVNSPVFPELQVTRPTGPFKPMYWNFQTLLELSNLLDLLLDFT